MNIIKFKRDTTFRNDMFTPESFSHPAKLDSQLLLWIVEKYTSPGETILDPMFGSGTCLLACTLGRHVIGVELEEKFVRMAQANWEKVRQRPQLGSTMGSCQIIHGDARNLSGLLADKILFSPPYEGLSLNQLSDVEKRVERMRKQGIPEDVIKHTLSNAMKQEYASKVDHIVTSPPYEGIEARDRAGDSSYKEDREVTHAGGSVKLMKGYQGSGDNIGNLKAESYLAAMKLVYEQCFGVLKLGGLMILITKNFIRDRKEIRLDLDTITLCQQAGFHFQERWYRELPAQSFWRILYKKKFPDAPELKFEDVLVFRKE